FATAGQYQNLGTASGHTAGTASCPGTTVSDSDYSHYLGVCEDQSPSILIEKATNGHDADVAPGPEIDVGDPVEWTYEVTNTGDVTLEGIVVSDNQGVSVSCSATSLAPGTSMTCAGSGFAIVGQYQNLGTVTGTSSGPAYCPGTTVSDSDYSHYWGNEDSGDQGCTPGYWKNHLDSWSPTGYSPGQSVPSVFSEAAAYPEAAAASLLDALNFGGGGGVEGAVRILLRASVAGLLDAAHPGVAYPRTPASVISDVNAALASGDRDTMLALKDGIDADNNLGCPLN
ncbi:MAG: hypothetical protein GY719_19800, partial [bacterium]|nr:hypothetical protein [bacterium]